MNFKLCSLPLCLLLCHFASPADARLLGAMQSIEVDQSGVQFDTRSDQRVQIDVLTPSLFRIRIGEHGKFIDAGNKASPIVEQQFSEKIPFQMEATDAYQLMRTSQFALRIYRSPMRFELYRADNKTLLWKELKPIDVAEKSTVQTLAADASEQIYGGGQQNGQFTFKDKLLEISYSGGWEERDRPSPAPFYMSSRGYGVLRNSWSNGSYDFRSRDYSTTTHAEGRFDAYYFVGNDIHDVLRQYTELTGRAKLLPRWAYEFGDADCYNDGDNKKKPNTYPKGWSDGPTGMTPDVVASVAAKYREYDMPGGWILPNDGYGCGYTDLPKVVEGLKKFGFKTGLWTENGVDKIAWEVGTAGTRAQKLDVAWTGQGYQFSLDANKAAADGILNHSDSRPFIWTVMGWAGTQRYAVTWTGDQSGSWDYIRWHIPTLIGSGLSGQAYATGDVDGIFGGSPETYTRDLQWKTFTPVLMGMSGWSQNERKHPWWFDEPYRSINRRYLKLKMRLMPYMYTLARETETSGAPIVRGLMWDHPQDAQAQTERFKYQFFLGRDFLVAPVYSSIAANKGWRKGIYVPQGEWIDYWDGRVTVAGKEGRLIDYPAPLDTLPLLVRAGAIIPMYPESLYDGQVPKDVLTLDIYPHGHSEYTLYEDDGHTRAYQQNAFSTQQFIVDAPTQGVGTVRVRLDAVQGQFDGIDEQRQYVLQLHTRAQPETVQLDGGELKHWANRADWLVAPSGWYFDAQEKFGVVHIKTQKGSVRVSHELTLAFGASAQITQTTPYPAMPAPPAWLAADQIMVLNRPNEEPGYPLENAFDGKGDTWFRTRRDQLQKTGPHEFVLALGDRRMIEGFEIQGRTGEYWKYGQPKEVELYLSDRNGEWGKPVYAGVLALKDAMQRVTFTPKAGSLLRFRVLSLYDPEADPMVLAAKKDSRSDAPYDASVLDAVGPMTLSEFHLIEHRQPERMPQQVYLSDLASIPVQVGHNAPAGAKSGSGMRMNGLQFHKGLGARAGQQLQFTLSGDWQTFRADIGIDDVCRTQGGMVFEVWGDERLLYRSGKVEAPAVVKPELDIRGVSHLSLLTTAGNGRTCGDWANARLEGFDGDVLK